MYNDRTVKDATFHGCDPTYFRWLESGNPTDLREAIGEVRYEIRDISENRLDFEVRMGLISKSIT